MKRLALILFVMIAFTSTAVSFAAEVEEESRFEDHQCLSRIACSGEILQRLLRLRGLSDDRQGGFRRRGF